MHSWKRRLTKISPAKRDAVALTLLAFAVWTVIEKTEACTRVFAYISAHPETELDSVILAGILMSLAMAIFSLQRWREARSAESAAHNIAAHDALTGLPNRRAFMAALDHAVAQGAPFSCLLLDLDNFKTVNDRHGHVAGDKLLQDVSQTLLKAAEGASIIARLGGDEFAIICPLAGADEDLHLAQGVLHSVQRYFKSNEASSTAGLSVGLARFPQDAADPAGLMRMADIALYDAKSSGRGRSRAFQPAMDEAIQRRADLGDALRLALSNGEISPYFQPLVELSGGRIVGYEVLARWRSPIHGDVPPSQFIPIATENGLIRDLSNALLLRACAEAATWPEPLRIAFNIAPHQLVDPDLLLTILSILGQTGLAPNRLELELTEDALLEDTDRANAVVMALKNLGVTLALDDFGTGYSSLHNLSVLPFDKIKIDRSFVAELVTSESSKTIVTAIIGLGRSLKIPVLAEGVETEAQAAVLRALGCQFAQGWLYGAAEPAGVLAEKLAVRARAPVEAPLFVPVQLAPSERRRVRL